MDVLLPFVAAFAALWLGYRFYGFYGRFIGRRMGEDNARPTPASVKFDNKDFIPTKTHVLFAHHFSTIAGAGPIIGPTLGIIILSLKAMVQTRRLPCRA